MCSPCFTPFWNTGDGLLVIPDDRGNIILERQQALEFLNREIRED